MNKSKVLSSCRLRMGRCYRCGKVFDMAPYLEATVESPISVIRPMGEIRHPVEDVAEAELSVKCPFCGYEYSEKDRVAKSQAENSS